MANNQGNNGGGQQDVNQLLQVRYDKLHELSGEWQGCRL